MEQAKIASQVDYWLTIAEYDLETARAMLKTDRYLYVGFMCQQAAEKGLKALIAQSGSFPPKIHDLVRLSERAGLVGILTDDQNLLLDELFPLNIEARYPAHKEQLAKLINEQRGQSFITRTEAFLAWIKQRL